MRKTLLFLSAVMSSLVGYSASADAKTPVTIYACMEREQINPMKTAIETANPDIEVTMVHDSTGVIIARALAERERPQASLVLGCAVTSMLVLKEAGLLEPYKPKGFESLKPIFRDESDPTSWIGMYAYLGIACYNTIEGKKLGVSAPKSWEDLLSPAYENRLVMPNPSSSGTGYMLVSFWIQLMGEERAWEYMDELHENIAQYTHSGSAPCVQAARGEQLLGLSLEMRAVSLKNSGAPIDIIVPAEGIGWEMNTSGVIKGRPAEETEAAKKVMDWLASREANELYNKYFAVVAHPEVSKIPPNYPKEAEARMLQKNNFSWVAANRDRILKEWASRYEGKSAPKG